MTLEFILAGSQIDGARDYQEDAFLITNLTDAEGKPSALIVVADGMGGHAAGNVASNMAVQAFNKNISANYPSDNLSTILKESLVQANDSIRETITETSALSGMGCTMVASVLEGGKLWWASVGDSHLYLIRNNELTKKNADHSYGGFLERMQAAGTPVEPEAGLSRNMLMSALTGEDINEMDVPDTPLNLAAGDRIIICSDGLDTLDADKIIQCIEAADSPKKSADALMSAVEEAKAPRQDNTTAVVVYVRTAETASASIRDETDPLSTGSAGTSAPARPLQEFEVEDGSRGRGVKIVAILAFIVVIAAVAAYFVLGDKKIPQVAEQAPPAVEEIKEAEEPQPEPATTQTEEPEPAATPPEVVEQAAQPAPEAPAEKPAEKPEEKAAPAKQPEAVADKAGGTLQDSLKSGGEGPVMVIIPAGTYQMGSSGASRHANERPRHAVTVDSFAASRHEITFAEYDLFANASGRKLPDSRGMDRATHPVIFVSWDDAYNYAKWLSKETGHKYRLLSEAHWEYIASTGAKTPFWWGFDEEPGRAHCFGCGTGLDPRQPTKTGSFKPNAFGVYDTAGNVNEWVHDCWHRNYKDAPDVAEVWEGGDCQVRIVRGGAYSTPMESLRHSKRDKYKPGAGYDSIGIRVMRELN